mmetsp:Transcript_38880/g.115248  ORF Transcript_38880/g.115248 Transcript_38880/m.115248 type:complete len:287 (+) Transcript_38880:88-948(+)
MEEKSAEELAKMSKEERKEYHLARRATTAGEPKPKPQAQSKAERRAVQEAQRKAKEDIANANLEGDELLKELMLQGLTEEQAKIVMAEIDAAKVEEGGDDEDSDEDEDLKWSIKKWMKEQEDPENMEDALHDFNLKVRFQGHVDSTPPDHVAAILTLLVEQACADSSLGALKQPMAVAKVVEPLVVRWAKILEPLYEKIDDALAASDVILTALKDAVAEQESVAAENSACAVVGFLMAVREIDMVEDEDLLLACKRADMQSVVMDKFISFLEEAVEEASDDDEDDD